MLIGRYSTFEITTLIFGYAISYQTKNNAETKMKNLQEWNTYLYKFDIWLARNIVPNHLGTQLNTTKSLERKDTLGYL